MKKLIVPLFILFFPAMNVFSQSKTSLEDVFAVLNADFEKYGWVHQLLGDKTEDSRAPNIKMNRLSYDVTLERNGETVVEAGEVVYVTIIKGGYRYDLKLDFSPKREKGAERSRTVKNRLYQKFLADIIPDKAISEQ